MAGLNRKSSVNSDDILSTSRIDTNATPELLLERNIKLAEKLFTQNKLSSAVKVRVKCVALSRMVYGDDNWCHAKSLLMLAKAYHEHGGRHDQTIYHAGQCRDLLLRLQKGSHDFPMEATKLLCRSYYLIGQSYMGEGLNAESEKAFTQAAHVLQQCCKVVGGAADVQLQIKITSSLGKAYLLQKKLDKAKYMLQEALEFVEENYGTDNSEEAIPILHSLSMVAQLSMEYNKSIELLKRAHTITLDHHGNKSVNMAASNQLLAGAHLLLWQHSDTKPSLEDTRKLLEESLEVYQNVKGVGDPDTLKCHKEYCRLLVLMEQHADAISQLEQLVELEKEYYGDINIEVGKSYQLLGTIRLSLGEVMKASSNFNQCQHIYRTVLGPRHKETQAVVATLETIQLHDMATGKAAAGLAQRPRFRTIV